MICFESLPDYGTEEYGFAALEVVMKRLPRSPAPLWTDGMEILCRDEAVAECIADLIDAMCGDSVAHTGYYDPEEDAKENKTYASTGFYYVDFD